MFFLFIPRPPETVQAGNVWERGLWFQMKWRNLRFLVFKMNRLYSKDEVYTVYNICVYNIYIYVCMQCRSLSLLYTDVIDCLFQVFFGNPGLDDPYWIRHVNLRIGLFVEATNQPVCCWTFQWVKSPSPTFFLWQLLGVTKPMVGILVNVESPKVVFS